MKKLLQQLKKEIRKGFGKKCPEFSFGCWTCMAYRALEDLADMFEVTEAPAKTFKKHK